MLPTNPIDRAKVQYDSALADLRNALATFEALADCTDYDKMAGLTKRISSYSFSLNQSASTLAQLAEKGLI